MKSSALLSWCLVALAASGCVVTRTVTLPEVASPVLQAPEVTARWDLGDIAVRAGGTDRAQGAVRDYRPLEEQLETRLRRTLEAQAGLGRRAGAKDYVVDVVVELGERSGVNPWILASAGAETATLLAGLGLGTAAGGPIGGLVGMLAATPLALLVAFAPPAATELGDLHATVVVRRPGEAALLTRRVRGGWRADVNAYSGARRLAQATGGAVQELELSLLDALRAALVEVPSPAAGAQSR